jgi:hypothetical protein
MDSCIIPFARVSKVILFSFHFLEYCCSFAQTFSNMAVLLRALRLIDSQRINSPKNYIYTGNEILEENGDSGYSIDETIDCSDSLLLKDGLI